MAFRLRCAALVAAWAMATGCGRIGYTAVELSPPDAAVEAGAPDQGAADLGAPDVAFDLPPDGAPPDLAADTSPDRPVDRPPDLAVDRPPDLAPDVPSARSPTFVRGTGASGTRSPLTMEHITGSGANRYLLVGVAIETAERSVTSVSYAGRPLSMLAMSPEGACAIALFGLVAPPAGAHPVVVTLDGNSDVVVLAVDYTGVRPTGSASAQASAVGINSPLSIPVSLVEGELLIDVVCLDHALPTLRPGAGQTLQARGVASTFMAAMSARAGQGDAQTVWSFDGSPADGWVTMFVGLRGL